MNKKFLSLVLALVMVLGTFTSVFAAAEAKEEVKVPKLTSNDAKIQWLVDHKVVEGRKVNEDEKNNDLALDKNIQRAEVTKLLVYAIGKADLAAKLNGVMVPYTDVAAGYWANGYITVGSTAPSPANGLPFLNGYPDKSFQPKNDVTYAELAKMLVVLAKKDLTADGIKAANNDWPRQWMAWAAELGILDGVTVADSSKAANRHDSFVMIYNAMFKLENLRKLPAGETMGIISGYSAGKLVVNQGDFKKDVTVDLNTTFVGEKATAGAPIISWNTAIANAGSNYFYGSLVRVLTDEKGVATHIIQLGNPQELALVSNGWRGVADGTIETLKDTAAKFLPDDSGLQFAYGLITTDAKDNAVYNNYDVNWSEKKIEGIDKVFEGTFKKPVNVNFTKETRFFVADVNATKLTEVTKADALKMFNRGNLYPNNVYVGYDVLPTSKILEATVVVFNDVDASASGSTVRVVTPTASNFVFDAHKDNMVAAKAELVKFDMRNYKVEFPFNYNLEKYDVVKVTEGLNGAKSVEMKINHSQDPIYKIVKVNDKEIDEMGYVPGRRIETITLQDKTGRNELTVDVRADNKYWFGDEVKVGAIVQVNPSGKNAVNMISVLPGNTPLRGNLLDDGRFAGAEDTLIKEGQIVSVETTAGGYSILNIKIDGKGNVIPYYAPTDVVSGLKAGDWIQFLTTDKVNPDHKAALATNIKVKDAAGNYVPVEKEDALQEIKGMVQALKDKYPTTASVTLDNLKEYQDAVKAIQDKIDALNLEDKAAWEADEVYKPEFAKHPYSPRVKNLTVAEAKLSSMGRELQALKSVDDIKALIEQEDLDAEADKVNALVKRINDSNADVVASSKFATLKAETQARIDALTARDGEVDATKDIDPALTAITK